MLRLELDKETNTVVVYNYFPEQEKEYGTVTIDKVTGDIVDTRIAVSDKHNRYLHHAASRIEKFFSEKSYPKEDIVAWY